MVHELLGIQNGRVDLSLVPDIRSELSVSKVFLLPGINLFHWVFFAGNYFDTFHRPILPRTFSCHVWRSWHLAQRLRTILPVPLSRPIAVLD